MVTKLPVARSVVVSEDHLCVPVAGLVIFNAEVILVWGEVKFVHGLHLLNFYDSVTAHEGLESSGALRVVTREVQRAVTLLCVGVGHDRAREKVLAIQFRSDANLHFYSLLVGDSTTIACGSDICQLKHLNLK